MCSLKLEASEIVQGRVDDGVRPKHATALHRPLLLADVPISCVPTCSSLVGVVTNLPLGGKVIHVADTWMGGSGFG